VVNEVGMDAIRLNEVRSTVVQPGDVLVGDIDLETQVREMPRSYLVKGMFFARLVDQLGADWSLVEGQLLQAPRGGRYVSFKDYPQADYMRLSVALARKLHPRQSVREAVRRVARKDFDVFAASTFGKVVLAVVGDARGALLKTPFVYGKMTSGDQVVEGFELDPRTVRLEFRPHYGSWEYVLGQLEGVAAHYGRPPVITVSELPEQTLRFDIEHS
jgi:uncharacterized protein (TIGR02265 family)